MPSPLSWHTPRAVFEDTVGVLLDTPPGVLLDLRFAELEAARVAADQVLVELVANARDAALSWRSAEPPRILLGLTGGSIFLANDGAPFARPSYQALGRIARSSKRGPQAGSPLGWPLSPMTLGRHGIGFRSVLSVCDRPRIYGHAEDGAPFALGFGEPRLASLARAALGEDVAACEAALPPGEAAWLRALLEEVPLGLRSLVRHGPRSGVGAEELARGLPVLSFPLALDPAEAPGVVAEALGWRGSGARPYVTVVELPLRAADLPRCLDQIEAQIPDARRCLQGTRIQLSLAGAPEGA